MAITSGQITIGTSAIAIGGSSTNPSRLHVHNDDNTKTLYLGSSDITAANGLALQKLDSTELELNAGEALYGISGSGNHVISWLRQTQD